MPAVEVLVDVTAPEVSASLDSRKRIVVEATDELSGVARIEVPTKKGRQSASKWAEYIGPIEVDGKTVVFIRPVEAAGNVSEVRELTRKDLAEHPSAASRVSPRPAAADRSRRRRSRAARGRAHAASTSRG